MNKPFKLAQFILFSIIISVYFVHPAQPLLAEEKAPEPHLIFKKSVVVKKYKAGQAYAEPRTVKKVNTFGKFSENIIKWLIPELLFIAK